MVSSACLIFNPVAGQGNPEIELQEIRAILEPHIDLDIHFTTEEINADQLAKAAVKRGVEAIIISGGDGTISAAAAAVINTNIPLGIIARGTANALAIALNIPVIIADACKTILKGYTKMIDVGYCDGQPMTLLAGIGFEAETIDRTDRETKNRLGMAAYVLSGLQELRDLKRFDVEIETEDRTIHTTASALTVANAAPPISVLAQGPAGIVFDDGLLDLTIVAPETRVDAIAATVHLFQTASSGDPVNRNDIDYLQAKRFKITTNPPQKVAIDGEIIGTTPIEIKCIPSALKVFVPYIEEIITEQTLTIQVNLQPETEYREQGTVY